MTSLNCPAAWPDFYVIGAGKSGTTTLYELLRRHRRIYIPVRKEPNYFSRRKFAPNYPQVSREEYLSLYRDAGEGQLKGDFSTSYFLCRQAPARIRECNEAARFIVIFRDPVTRAFSDYLMLSRRDRLIRRDFITEITCELERLRAGRVEWPFFVKTGLYATNVTAYLDQFPKERFLFLSLGELKSSPQTVYERICNFLDIEVLPVEGRRLRSKTNPSSELRSRWLRKLLHGSGLSRAVARLTPGRARHGLDNLRRRILYRPAEKPRMPGQAWPLLRPVFEEELSRLQTLIDFDVSVLTRRWPRRPREADLKLRKTPSFRPG